MASLTRGDQVWVKTSKDKEGSRETIEEKAEEPESYYVRIINLYKYIIYKRDTD